MADWCWRLFVAVVAVVVVVVVRDRDAVCAVCSVGWTVWRIVFVSRALSSIMHAGQILPLPLQLRFARHRRCARLTNDTTGLEAGLQRTTAGDCREQATAAEAVTAGPYVPRLLLILQLLFRRCCCSGWWRWR